MMYPRQCKRDTCRAWANRSGFCPGHDEEAQERMRRVYGTPMVRMSRSEAARVRENKRRCV